MNVDNPSAGQGKKLYEQCGLCDLGVLETEFEKCSQSGGEGIYSYENLSRDRPEQIERYINASLQQRIIDAELRRDFAFLGICDATKRVFQSFNLQ